MGLKILLFCFLTAFSIGMKAQKKKSFDNDYNMVIRENDPDKIIMGMAKLIKKYKLDTLKHEEGFDVFNGSVAIAYLKKDDFKNFERYIGKIKNKFNKTSYMNEAAEELYESKRNINYAVKLAENTIRVYESYKDDPKAKPSYFDPKEWDRFMKMAAYPYNETFAKVLYAQGKTDTALYYLEKALQNEDLENMRPETTQLYSSLLIAEHHNEKAYKLLRREAELGRATNVMVDQFKTLYTKLTGKNSDLVMDSIQKNVNSRYVQEVSKKIITGQQAFNFNLKTLDGNTVSLKSLRGKVVVLDFWATWCVPCIKSLPTMIKISEKNPDVVFLYIATREEESNTVQRIKKFMKKHQFTFKVLLDIPDKNNPKSFVTQYNYKIEGIPAKVVIDKNGAIKFSSVGFRSESELSNDLQAMIDIVKGQ